MLNLYILVMLIVQWLVDYVPGHFAKFINFKAFLRRLI